MLPSMRIINELIKLGFTRNQAIELLVEFIFEMRYYESKISKKKCVFRSS